MNEIEINNKTKSRVNLKIIRRIAEKFLALNKSRIFQRGVKSRRKDFFITPYSCRKIAGRSGKVRDKINNIILSIAFIGDKEMRRLNNKYRRKNRPTDILSFTGKDNFLGEIIMDYAQIRRQAKIFGNKVNSELYFILIHGLLHLLGYNDKTEKGKKEMERLGDKFFKSMSNKSLS